MGPTRAPEDQACGDAEQKKGSLVQTGERESRHPSRDGHTPRVLHMGDTVMIGEGRMGRIGGNGEERWDD